MTDNDRVADVRTRAKQFISVATEHTAHDPRYGLLHSYHRQLRAAQEPGAA